MGETEAIQDANVVWEILRDALVRTPRRVIALGPRPVAGEPGLRVTLPGGRQLILLPQARQAGGEPRAAASAEQRYRNALTWVRHVAGLHYMGGAFDPEHMRDLANLATAALQGKGFPDYDEAMARGRQDAARYAALFGALADGPEGGDGP